MAQLILENSLRSVYLAKSFRDKWTPALNKILAKLQTLLNELIIEPFSQNDDSHGSMELSIHGQYLLNECLEQLQEEMTTLYQEHRAIHPPISKCGRDLDRNFHADLNNLIKNEKNIETNPDYLQKANRLIFEHLLSIGRVDVVETFMRESESRFEIPQDYDIDLVKSVMEPFRKHNYLPAIEWVSLHYPDREDLLFRLHSQHMIYLLENGNKKEALLYGRELQPFADKYKNEISQLMFTAASYPNLNKERYEHLFHEGRWLNLEEDLALVFCNFHSPLANLINTGAKAVPRLIALRSMARRNNPEAVHFVDELPMDVGVEYHVHSSFTCPILRTQSTEHNPPMRLSCGHVISSEALNKLATQSHNQRLKCPYCPEESNLLDAIRIYF